MTSEVGWAKPKARKGVPPEAADASEARVIADVREHGCHIVLVVNTEDDEAGLPRYAFSVGLHHTLGAPEIVVFGLKPDVMKSMINEFMGRVRGGERFELNREYGGFIDGHDVCFTSVDREEYEEHLGFAGWFYGGWEFPCWQMVWPTTRGVWPWDSGAPAIVRARQPILGAVPRLGA